MSKSRKPSTRRYRSEQEAFWAGAFGDDYIGRNRSDRLLAANLALFARVLGRTQDVRSVIELGANVGMNLKAIRALCPGATCTGVEINAKAVRELRRIPGVKAVHASLFDCDPGIHDFAFTKGVLIHLNPDLLPLAYDRLAGVGGRYVAMIEYYNPAPVEVPYRGHTARLYKRDFAGEFMKRHGEFRLVDYGFIYHGDLVFAQDDLTWFLMERFART